jgi:hypothetical protein
MFKLFFVFFGTNGCWSTGAHIVFEALIFRKAAVASLCCASWVKLYYLAGLADALSQIIINCDVRSLISEI